MFLFSLQLFASDPLGEPMAYPGSSVHTSYGDNIALTLKMAMRNCEYLKRTLSGALACQLKRVSAGNVQNNSLSAAFLSSPTELSVWEVQHALKELAYKIRTLQIVSNLDKAQLGRLQQMLEKYGVVCSRGEELGESLFDTADKVLDFDTLARRKMKVIESFPNIIAEKEQLQEVISLKDQTISELRKENNALLRLFEDKDGAIRNLAAQSAQQNESLQEQKTHIEALKQECQKLPSLHDIIRSQKKDIGELREKLSSHESVAVKRKLLIAQFQEQYDTLCLDVREKLSLYERGAVESELQIKKLQQGNEALRLNVAQLRQGQEILKTLQEQLARYKAEKTSYEQKILSEKKQFLETIEKQAQEMVRQTQRINDLLEKLRAHERIIAERDHAVEVLKTLQQELNDRDNRLVLVRKECDQFKTEVRDFGQKNAALKSELEQQYKQTQSVMGERDALQKQLDEALKKIGAQEIENKKETQTYSTEISALRQESALLQKRLAEAQTQCEKKLLAQDQEIERLKAKITQFSPAKASESAVTTASLGTASNKKSASQPKLAEKKSSKGGKTLSSTEEQIFAEMEKKNKRYDVDKQEAEAQSAQRRTEDLANFKRAIGACNVSEVSRLLKKYKADPVVAALFNKHCLFFDGNESLYEAVDQLLHVNCREYKIAIGTFMLAYVRKKRDDFAKYLQPYHRLPEDLLLQLCPLLFLLSKESKETNLGMPPDLCESYFGKISSHKKEVALWKILIVREYIKCCAIQTQTASEYARNDDKRYQAIIDSAASSLNLLKNWNDPWIIEEQLVSVWVNRLTDGEECLIPKETLNAIIISKFFPAMKSGVGATTSSAAAAAASSATSSVSTVVAVLKTEEEVPEEYRTALIKNDFKTANKYVEQYEAQRGDLMSLLEVADSIKSLASKKIAAKILAILQ